jgi:hypothetical protein
MRIINQNPEAMCSRGNVITFEKSGRWPVLRATQSTIVMARLTWARKLQHALEKWIDRYVRRVR